MNQTQIIDRYGELIEKKKTIEKELEEIKDKIIKLGMGQHFGKKFTATITTSVTHEYDKEKLFAKLGKTLYIKCSSIQAQLLKEHLSPTELSKYITSSKEVIKIITKKLE